MTWKMRGLLGAALVVVLSCGPGKDDAVRLKEGATLDDIVECPGLVCAGELLQIPTEFCGELLFDYGRSPPLCLPTGNGTDETGARIPYICDRLECAEQGKKCVVFDGTPYQVYCIKDDEAPAEP